MRTKEQGLLTTADCMAILMIHEMPMIASAHGGDVSAARDCRACKQLQAQLAEWIGAHAAGPEELEELERDG
jgi:copper oxidase (laccase) domain-containing protein